MNELPLYFGGHLVGEDIRFECRQCGACCSGEGFVFITQKEGAAIASYLGMATGRFFRQMTRKYYGQRSLIDGPSGGCLFLEDSSCRIYSCRPYQCRSYPFWLNNLRSDRSWHRTLRECPGLGHGRLYSVEEIIDWISGSPWPPLKK